ncbi:MAG: 6,7-dimethyl-8-ribityllumazine synthase [Opitutales bacterium]|nr:6,7-dimethyl-8-ribityllumazine synthase [Opitutales bacterium]MCH8540046.1 6,7-dimethyl-8-ribityllumazine synthase [Opitutales bacterium]
MPSLPEASRYRVAIVAASFNPVLVDALLGQTQEGLIRHGADQDKITVYRVPGSNEIPWAVQTAADSGEFDVIIALGLLKKGATAHYHIVAQSVSDALQMVSLNSGLPVINGVIVAENDEQAHERVHGEIDRAGEFAYTALSMAALRQQMGALYENS